MDNHIYKAPEAGLEEEAGKLKEWSGKKVFFITALPALFYSFFTLYRVQAEGVLQTEWSTLVMTGVLAMICAVWTGCHSARARGGNWIDCVGYCLIWAVIHAVAGIIFSIVLMLAFAIFLRNVL